MHLTGNKTLKAVVERRKNGVNKKLRYGIVIAYERLTAVR